MYAKCVPKKAGDLRPRDRMGGPKEGIDHRNAAATSAGESPWCVAGRQQA
jgi:hypothetical protein